MSTNTRMRLVNQCARHALWGLWQMSHAVLVAQSVRRAKLELRAGIAGPDSTALQKIPWKHASFALWVTSSRQSNPLGASRAHQVGMPTSLAERHAPRVRLSHTPRIRTPRSAPRVLEDGPHPAVTHPPFVRCAQEANSPPRATTAPHVRPGSFGRAAAHRTRQSLANLALRGIRKRNTLSRRACRARQGLPSRSRLRRAASTAPAAASRTTQQ